MARGWESKSVEEQQAQAREDSPRNRARLTPAEVAARRHKDNLVLASKHTREQLQRARNPLHRKALESALADLERQLAALGVTLLSDSSQSGPDV